MAAHDDLTFPRLVYRGEADTLGEGKGETKRVEDKQDYEAAVKDGWRLVREDGKPKKVDPGTIKIPAQTVHVDGTSVEANKAAQQRADADAQADKDTAARAKAKVESGHTGTAGPVKNAIGKK